MKSKRHFNRTASRTTSRSRTPNGTATCRCNATTGLRKGCRASIGVVVLGALCAVWTGTGCGVNRDELLFQTGSSVANTAFDLFLTGLTNAVADSFDDQMADDDGGGGGGNGDGDGNGDDNGNGGDGDGGDGNGNGDVNGGDPVDAGRVIYEDRCMGCHGDPGMNNATFPGAPDIIGVSASTIADIIATNALHASFADLTADDQANIEAFLAS